MNYRTTCPQCTSVFRLGEQQLGAAGGWAQCGVCGAAFDARLSLLLEDGSAPTAVNRYAPQQEAPVDTPPGEAVRLDDPARLEPSFDLPPAAASDTWIPDPSLDDPYPVEPVAADIPGPPDVQIEYAPSSPSKPGRIMPWIWGLASVLLLAVLLAQTAYFLRDTLVSRLPQTRPAFEQACAVLGCTLSLPKNQWVGSCQDLIMLPRKRSIKLSGCEAATPLQIVGSDLQTEANGQLRLSLTLGNRDNYAQAWPMLVLTLTDQRNRPLARRSFAPSEYLGETQRIAAGIPPRSEQLLSLPLTVNKLAPMGFNLKLTY